MPIKILCRCGRNLLVPDHRAGRAVQCPKCQQTVDVPGERVELPEKKQPTPPVLPPRPPQPTPAKTLIVEPVAIAPPAPTPSLAKVAAAPVVSPTPTPPPPASVKVAKPHAPLPKVVAPPVTPPPPPKVIAPVARPEKVLEPVAPPAPPVPEVVAPSPPPPLPAEPKFELAPPIAPPTTPTIPARKPPPPAPKPTPAPAPRRPKLPSAKELVSAALTSARPAYRPDSEKLTAAYVLSMLLVALGVFSLAPGVLDVVRYLRDTDSGFVGRWAFVAFFLSLLHFAYAFYLGQLPDWSSSWVLTGATLVQAAAYAALLTALHLAGGQSQIVDLLDLGPHVDNGHARAWCFVMLCVTGVVAYFCGQVSMRWRRAFVMVRTASRRGV